MASLFHAALHSLMRIHQALIKKKILQLLGAAYLKLLTSMYILNKHLDLISELQANPLNVVIRFIPTEPPKFSSFYQGDGAFFGADGAMQEK